jgi:hypothetical protein
MKGKVGARPFLVKNSIAVGFSDEIRQTDIDEESLTQRINISEDTTRQNDQ